MTKRQKSQGIKDQAHTAARDPSTKILKVRDSLDVHKHSKLVMEETIRRDYEALLELSRR